MFSLTLPLSKLAAEGFSVPLSFPKGFVVHSSLTMRHTLPNPGTWVAQPHSDPRPRLANGFSPRSIIANSSAVKSSRKFTLLRHR